MNPHDNKKKRSLKRHFVVHLNEKETKNLRTYKTEKAGYDYLKGKPRLIRKRNGKYVAKIFRRFGIDQGSTTAIGKIKFIGDRELAVTIKSGGLGIGYFFLLGLILSVAYEIWSILQPTVVEDLELVVDHFASVFVIGVFGFMSWIFLSRNMREPDLETMEGYLKGKIGGEWHET